MVAKLFNFPVPWGVNPELNQEGQRSSLISKRTVILASVVATSVFSLQSACSEFNDGNLMAAFSYASYGLGGVVSSLAIGILGCRERPTLEGEPLTETQQKTLPREVNSLIHLSPVQDGSNSSDGTAHKDSHKPVFDMDDEPEQLSRERHLSDPGPETKRAEIAPSIPIEEPGISEIQQARMWNLVPVSSVNRFFSGDQLYDECTLGSDPDMHSYRYLHQMFDELKEAYAHDLEEQLKALPVESWIQLQLNLIVMHSNYKEEKPANEAGVKSLVLDSHFDEACGSDFDEDGFVKVDRFMSPKLLLEAFYGTQDQVLGGGEWNAYTGTGYCKDIPSMAEIISLLEDPSNLDVGELKVIFALTLIKMQAESIMIQKQLLEQKSVGTGNEAYDKFEKIVQSSPELSLILKCP